MIPKLEDTALSLAATNASASAKTTARSFRDTCHATFVFVMQFIFAQQDARFYLTDGSQKYMGKVWVPVPGRDPRYPTVPFYTFIAQLVMTPVTDAGVEIKDLPTKRLFTFFPSGFADPKPELFSAYAQEGGKVWVEETFKEKTAGDERLAAVQAKLEELKKQAVQGMAYSKLFTEHWWPVKVLEQWIDVSASTVPYPQPCSALL